ncbi:MAG: hypothetical protein LC676_17925 [Loktanella sp.]|nr:hypothetical protein [Loktanella sp.]
MKRTALTAMTLVMASTVAGHAQQDCETDHDDWLRSAEMGPYQPETEDWDAIMAAAQDEPGLTIYSSTSRVLDVVDQMNAEWGVEMEALNLSTNELIERVRREWDAGLRNVGLVNNGNPGQMYEALVQRCALVNYIPRELQERIPEAETLPLLRHRYSVGTWYYNSPDDTVPYDNIWDLTTEDFRNRVVVRDPLESGTMMEVFTAFVMNADALEVLYEENFGEPIELTTQSAGYEFWKRMLDNDVRIVAGSRDVAQTVTEADGVMVGLSTQSAYRNVIEGIYDFNLDTEVAPTVLTMRLMGVGMETDSPNQAKLMVRHLMSQEGGSPWWGADFPVDPTIEPTGEMADLTLDSFATLWEPKVEDQIAVRDEFIDFYLANR